MGRIEKAYASIAEGQVHMRRQAGTGEGAPLVMLHASPSSAQSLVALMEALGDTRELIAFDNPCNGQSCAPAPEEPEIADFADMLARACDALGLSQVTVFGSHTGAHIAIAWALARPEQVSALVLDGVALIDADMREELLTYYAPPQRPDAYGSQFHWAWQYVRDQMIFWPHYRKDAAHKRPGGTFDAASLHGITLDILGSLETYHKPYHAVFRHEVRSDLAQLGVPVLVLDGGDGPLDPANAEICQLVSKAHSAAGCDTIERKAEAICEFLKGQ